MSTSNTYSWSATTSDIINRALRIVGAIPVGNTASTNDYNNAKYTLNAINKRIAVDGIKLWTLEEITFTIGTPSTVLATDGSYQYCIKSHLSSADNYPISGATSTDYWYKGAEATTTAWTSGTNYSSNIEVSISGQYIAVDSAFWRDTNTDYNLQVISKQEWLKFEDKFVRSTIPSHIAIDTTRDSISGIIYPVPYISTGRLHLNLVRSLQDFSNTTDNPDFPSEWVDALTYMLAASICDEYSLQLDERLYLQNKAKELYREAKGNDRTTINIRTVRGAYRV